MSHNILALDFSIDDTYPNGQHEDVPSTDDNNTLLTNATSIQDNIAPADICKVLSIISNINQSSQKTTHVSLDDTTVTIDGIKYGK